MIKVKVPATSANIGPGFDSLGLALNLYNKFAFEEIPQGLEITGCDGRYKNKYNLVYRAAIKTLVKIGYKVSGLRIHMETTIPPSRGLGSSAACILGGVLGANKLAGMPLSKEDILGIATGIEGHPDNIAPALLGGLVVSILEDKKVYSSQVPVAKGIKFIALVPDFTLSTKKARAVLPSNVPYKDAVYNVGRVSLLLSAFSSGRFDLLKLGVKDSLHQPYRGDLIQGFQSILEKSEELGSLGVYLSGAGPTIMAMVEEDNMDFIREIRNYLDSMNYKWNVLDLEMDLCGAVYE
ncbi:MAG: homoserine kinase [Tissierellia bacterium]|nr:homoserine kinase [Tissierellia bacterium]